ncbi:MAG: type IV secretion system DNA-binding domain-containing protein, partial [Boseongicola sp. SB0673_bin_14]|nr:type IV secretion system DNA-binding domain-containing protein [Boseongicola sp. SB0673_bin_14]
RRIWVILDELPTLHQVPSLQPGLAESRQFGGCFVLGVQVASALRDLYGRNGAETISGLCGTRVVLAAPDRDTAQWSADSLGRSEVEEVAEGFSYGANTIRDGVSLTPRRELRALALPSEIMRLKNLSGYLKFPGPFPVASIRLKHVKRPAAAARFVPREGEDSGRSGDPDVAGTETGSDAAGPDDCVEGAAPAPNGPGEALNSKGPAGPGMPPKSGKALRDEGGVARGMPSEPAALQEVLALPSPDGPHKDAPAGGRPGRKVGRKARRAGSRAAESPDGIPQDGTGEALPGEGPAGPSGAVRPNSGDGDWG